MLHFCCRPFGLDPEKERELSACWARFFATGAPEDYLHCCELRRGATEGENAPRA